MRLVEAGNFSNTAAGLIGLGTKLPPQLGHTSFSFFFAQVEQKVHSNVQITASWLSGGKSLSQHSQLGLSSSILSPTVTPINNWSAHKVI